MVETPELQSEFGKKIPVLDYAPKVSVGMPVYNGAGTISTAIAAVQKQTFEDFELVISDNGSTDDTLQICKAAASRDSRIRIIRQGENRGPGANFEAVLAAARGAFFMFAAVDDWIEPQFLDEALTALEGASDAVACAPRTRIHFPDGRTREARGSKPIRGPDWLRPAVYLLRPADNSRFYGLYRTPALRAAFSIEKQFYGLDWMISALTLKQGAHLRSKSIILHREGAERDKYSLQHLRDASNWLDRLLPLARLSVALVANLAPGQRLLAIPALCLLNARQSVELLVAYVRASAHK